MLIHCYYKLRPEKRRQLVFHCDNCTGQNKNNCTVKMLCWLVLQGHSEDIQLKFMVRGHTKFGPDSHFGVIKKAFQSRDCYTLDHVYNLINKSSEETNQCFIFPSRKFFGSYAQ
eukprot:NODE_192_length_15450_cov_0.476355.p13 type:complete len:114 gc:universal NODE_192_length_15450_cov_0.476355:12835-13176(+)